MRGLQLLEVLLGLLARILDRFGLLRECVALTNGNINLCLLSIDLCCPGLELFLLRFDLVMENLCLICGKKRSKLSALGSFTQLAFQAIPDAL